MLSLIIKKHIAYKIKANSKRRHAKLEMYIYSPFCIFMQNHYCFA